MAPATPAATGHGRRLDILPLKPQRVYQELRQVLPRNTIVTIDAGAAASHAYNLLDFYEPRTFITPGISDVSGRGFRQRWAPNWRAGSASGVSLR
jgi:thiamine pyrophosphate-dependent acetolactate synthase large subunit-like protein